MRLGFICVQVAQGMLKGRADTLTSSFHLRYNMLLNLLRVDFMEPEEMLRRSFHQFQNDAAIPLLKQRTFLFLSEIFILHFKIFLHPHIKTRTLKLISHPINRTIRIRERERINCY
jgi:hypothetical protein